LVSYPSLLNKHHLSLFLASLFFFLALGYGIAVPVRPLGPVNISGKVNDLNWVPEKKIKATHGMSGSAGRDRTIPAHFLVKLENFEGIDSRTAVIMTRYIDRSAFKNQGWDVKPPFILLKINHTDQNYLRKGMKIKVSGYTVRGDEGGVWTYFTRIDVI